MRCLITGAASGIGRALALHAAKAGATVLGLDVDAEQVSNLENELGSGHAVFPVDLTDRAAVTALLESPELRDPLDVVVHSAGISAVGRFQDTPIGAQLAVIDVNLRAPIQITTELLRGDRIARGGRLVFLSSLSHYVSYPGAAGYAATKDGLASYARSLSVALAPRGIHVTTVYPGPTRTPHARRYSPDPDAESGRMPPERVAEAIWRAVIRGQRTVIPGGANKGIAALGRLSPRLSEWLMKKAILEKLDLGTPERRPDSA